MNPSNDQTRIEIIDENEAEEENESSSTSNCAATTRRTTTASDPSLLSVPVDAAPFTTSSRSSSVVSYTSTAMESDNDSPPPGSCETFPIPNPPLPIAPLDVPSSSTTTNSSSDVSVVVAAAASASAASAAATDSASISGPSSTFDTDDDLDDLASPAKKKRSFKKLTSVKDRQQSWGLLRQMLFWSPFVQEYKKKYPWVQLAGHEGSFKPGAVGTILKKATSWEKVALEKIQGDVIKQFVPDFHGVVQQEGQPYLQMQDLLANFEDPAVMDIKMGIRTYLADELMKAKAKGELRPDLYEKMVKIDNSAPTDAENDQKAITKPRYMQWRETISTTAEYGYRIEAVKLPHEGPHIKPFKMMKDPRQVAKWLNQFSFENDKIRATIIDRLHQLRTALEQSPFFQQHEVIGSSLLFVCDTIGNAGVWMIDFGKTTANRNEVTDPRNRGDGYLFGLDNLIGVWESI
ncbi:inositol-trisphosphate 3-kinase B-like [Oscarella lobularis]|uniref:inositol-trisphosphate 3-kinase B-like n=1 Tax=Oscarella lobularis TaxID=121494 RepID=UPI003313D1F2